MPKAGESGTPSPVAGREDFICYPDVDPMPPMAGPMLTGSHGITADLIVSGKEAEGIIFADDGRYGGAVLYVKKGRLIYENNFFGMSRDLLISHEPLTPGHHEMAYVYAPNDSTVWGGGMGQLLVDGEIVAESRLAHVGIPYTFGSLGFGTRLAGEPRIPAAPLGSPGRSRTSESI